MATHNHTLNYLSEKTWYWIAGLFEGEGSLSIPSAVVDNHPTFSLSMTDEDVISKLARYLGVKYYTRKPKNKNHKTAYVVQFRNRTRITWIIENIFELMSKRRQEKMTEVLDVYKQKDEHKC